MRAIHQSKHASHPTSHPPADHIVSVIMFLASPQRHNNDSPCDAQGDAETGSRDLRPRQDVVSDTLDNTALVVKAQRPVGER